MKNAYVFFAEGFEEIEGLTIIDVLRRADIPVKMVSVSGSKEVTGAHGIQIVADVLIDEINVEDAEILILPGGMPGAKNLNEHQVLKGHLKNFANSGKKLAAICAAPLVLGGLNILEGKNAVCYPGFEDQLTGATIKYEPSLKSDNIITGRGPGAALNFSLSLVEELKGKETADQLARAMLVQTW